MSPNVATTRLLVGPIVCVVAALTSDRPNAGPACNHSRVGDSDGELHAGAGGARQGLVRRREPERDLVAVGQGAVAIEAVFGGSAEFGGSAVLEPIVATRQRPRFHVPGCRRADRNAPPDNKGLLVLEDGNIRAAEDLVGKTISAGLINSVNYVHMHEWLKKKGVDRSKIEFLEFPFPQMADALFQKRIDAVWNVEPFVTVMIEPGKARDDRPSLPGHSPGYGHHHLLRQGYLAEGQPRRSAPLRARDRPRHPFSGRPRRSGTNGSRNLPA